MAYRSKLKAMVEARCPQCRTGKIFVGNAYNFRKQRTNDICPYCGLEFEIEPGYFYAAMYVSYAMAVLEILIIGFFTYLFSHSESPWLYSIILFFTVLLLAPFNYRYSRLLLLFYLTPKIKYDPKYQQDSLE
ncbi:hypothetical protein GCM10023231_09210 [Olivibacter ginsenosidimutans]|uniref:DUF983 domain-containing protein n=1 Tax=Olivibacter ginsenosidimutans TaxID=1176537 RepID=A0ABP9ANK8_9SPHI